MSFLGLSLAQVAILSAATAAAIVGLYLLKPPPKTITVSSILLWSRIVKERKTSSDRLRWWMSLLLALAIGLSMALALGRPETGGAEGSGRTAIVVDNSPTMATRAADGRSRWEHALDQARRILAEAGRGGDVGQLLIADTAGQIVAPSFETFDEARRQLEGLTVAAPGEQTFPQLLLEGAKLYFVTDGVMVDPSQVPAETEVISVFEPADNVGITRFEIQPLPAEPTRYEAFIEVVNGGLEEREAEIVVSGTGEKRVRKMVTIPAGEAAGVVMDMSDFPGGVLRAAVTSMGDSLDLDNFAFAFLPEHRRIRVVIVTDENSYLESFSSPRFELYKLRPESFREIPAADVYVLDGFVPAEPPRRPCLYIRPPEASWLPVSGGEVESVRVTAWDRDHAVLQSLSLEDLTVHRALRLDPKGDETRALVSSEEGALILTETSPRRWLLLAFSLEDTNFPLMAGFPIFLSNALTWLVGEPAAVTHPVGLVETPSANARVTSLMGDEVATHPMGERSFFETSEPGAYTADEGATKIYILVNLMDPSVSHPNRTSFPGGGIEALEGVPPNSERSPDGHAELWMLLLGLATGLLGLEWWTYNRRWTT